MDCNTSYESAKCLNTEFQDGLNSALNPSADSPFVYDYNCRPPSHWHTRGPGFYSLLLHGLHISQSWSGQERGRPGWNPHWSLQGRWGLCLTSRDDWVEDIAPAHRCSRWWNVNSHNNDVLDSNMSRITPLRVYRDSKTSSSLLTALLSSILILAWSRLVQTVPEKQSKLHSLLTRWLFTKAVSSFVLLASDLTLMINGRKFLNFLSLLILSLTFTPALLLPR